MTSEVPPCKGCAHLVRLLVQDEKTKQFEIIACCVLHDRETDGKGCKDWTRKDDDDW